MAWCKRSFQLFKKDELHAIVTITGDGHFRIEGMRGNYQNTTPSNVGIFKASQMDLLKY